MSSLQLSLLLFSVTVRYQTSSIHLHSVSQKLAHSQHKPTNKTEYSLFHIYSPRGGGGGVMTLHDYGYLPPEFLKSHPVSE